MKKLYKLPVLLLFPLLLISCENDEEMSEEPDPIWEEHEAFLYSNKVTYNSFADSNNLYVLGRKSLTPLYDFGVLEAENHYLIGDYDQSFQLPICDDFIIRTGPSSLEFIPLRSPTNGGLGTTLWMNQYDSDFHAFAFPYLEEAECIAINSRKECLIPYITTKEPVVKLLLVTPEILPSGEITNLSVEKLSISSGDARVVVHSFEDDFFITTSNGTYKIDGSGALNKVSEESFHGMFELEDRIYGLAGYGDLYTTSDGNTWNPLGAFTARLDLLNFDEVDGRLIGFHQSELSLLEEKEGEIAFTDLENQGLQGHEITSVAAFDDKVFVTTYSGVFYKSIEDFFREKKDIAE